MASLAASVPTGPASAPATAAAAASQPIPTQRVDRVPRARAADSDDEDEDGIYVPTVDPLNPSHVLTEEERKARRRFAGQGKPLSQAIPGVWKYWGDQMQLCARNGETDACVEYAMALWKGNDLMGVSIDRKSSYRWISRVVSRAPHDLYSKGGCGPSNCHKCHAILLQRKMQEWFADEETRQKSAAQYVVLHSPKLVLHICSFLDPKTLLTMRQTSTFWANVVKDDRAWAHLDMPSLFPVPRLVPAPASEGGNLALPHGYKCKSCAAPVTPETPRLDAVQLPLYLNLFFPVTLDCFSARAAGILHPLSLADAKMLLRQWEDKAQAETELAWEKAAADKLKIKPLQPPIYAEVVGMKLTSKAKAIISEPLTPKRTYKSRVKDKTSSSPAVGTTEDKPLVTRKPESNPTSLSRTPSAAAVMAGVQPSPSPTGAGAGGVLRLRKGVSDKIVDQVVSSPAPANVPTSQLSLRTAPSADKPPLPSKSRTPVAKSFSSSKGAPAASKGSLMASIAAAPTMPGPDSRLGGSDDDDDFSDGDAAALAASLMGTPSPAAPTAAAATPEGGADAAAVAAAAFAGVLGKAPSRSPVADGKSKNKGMEIAANHNDAWPDSNSNPAPAPAPAPAAPAAPSTTPAGTGYIIVEGERRKLPPKGRQGGRAAADQRDSDPEDASNGAAEGNNGPEASPTANAGENGGMLQPDRWLPEWLPYAPGSKEDPRTAVARWELDEQILVQMPCRAAAAAASSKSPEASPVGGSPPGCELEAGEEPAMPLVLELAREQWGRLKGYRWLRLRQQMLTHLRCTECDQ